MFPLHINHGEIRIRHIRVKRENGPFQTLVRQLGQFLIHTATRMRHHPVTAEADIVQLFCQVTEFVHDNVHLIRVNAESFFGC